MGFSPCLQVQSNPSSHTFPVFPINFNNSNFNSCRGCCLHWRKTREGLISLVVASPLQLSSSRLILRSASPSAYPPSRSLSESLESDAFPKIRDKFNHSDSYNNEEVKEERKRKRKPRPSFNDLTMQRWSRHSPSQRHSFPWQTQHSDSSCSPSPSNSSPPPPPPPPPPSSSPSSLHDLHNDNFNFPNSEDKPHAQLEVEFGEDTSYVAVASPSPSQIQTNSLREIEADSYSRQTSLQSESAHQVCTAGLDKTVSGKPTTLKRVLLRDSASANVTPSSKSIPILSNRSIAEPTVSLPWERERKMTTDTHDQNQNKLRRKGSNTELAERIVPEQELQRLRDAALRMKERMKVGPAGVTEAVVQVIHNKWKEEEVVKLRFEGPPSLHMMRTHQILEVHKLFYCLLLFFL